MRLTPISLALVALLTSHATFAQSSPSVPPAKTSPALPAATPSAAPAPKPAPPPDPEWYARLDALTYTDGDFSLPYRLLKPESPEPGKRYPLILFLHGVGEVGTDNKRHLGNSVGEIVKYGSAKEPFFLLAPQSRGWWVGVHWNLDSHVMPEKPTRNLAAVVALLEQIEKTHPVDPKRIYVTGLSMGGLGVWDIISRHPEKFAAAVPVCGAADLAQAPKLVNLPLWTFHGDKDTVIKVHRSRDMVAAIRAAGGHPIYTERPGLGHNAWDAAYKNIYVYDWLFAQSKK